MKKQLALFILQNKTLLLTVCFFLSIWQPLFAQYQNLIHYDQKDGLLGKQCYTVTQDSRGFIWLGTKNGVLKFDGYYFEPITEGEVLESKDVFTLGEDKYGRMWLGAKGPKLYYVDVYTNKIHQFTPTNCPIWDSLSFEMIHISPKGELWVNAKKGKQLMGFHLKHNEIQQTLYELHIDATVAWQEKEILFTRRLKRCLDAKTLKNSTDLPSERPENGLIISRDMTNPQAFVGGAEGDYFYFNGEEFICYQTNGTFCGITRQHLYFFDAQTYELLIYDKKGNPVKKHKPLFQKKKVNVAWVTEDKDGNLWITTENSGLYMLPVRAQHTISFNNNDEWSNLSDIVIDETGTAYLASLDSNFYYLEHQKIKTIPKPKKFSQDDYERKICWDKKHNRLFWGGQARQVIGEKNKKLAIALKVEQMVGCLKNLSVTDEGYLLIATCGHIIRVRIEKEAIYQDTLFRERSYAAVQDKEKNLWIGQTNGLSKLAANKQKQFLGDKFPICKNYVRELLIDKAGYLWVGTDNTGLYVYDIARNQVLVIEQTGETMINDLFEDEKGCIYAATNQGIYKVRLKNTPQLAYDWEYLGIGEGLSFKNVSGISVYRDTIFATNDEVLTLIPQETIDGKGDMPKLWITNFLISSRKGIVDSVFRPHYELAYHQNRLKISFTALSYQSCQKIVYKYRLTEKSSGNKANFQTVSLRRDAPSLDFPALNPGSYLLEIYAEDAWGRKTETIRFSLNIKPPWWTSAWFYALILLILLAAVYAFFAWETYQAKKEMQLQLSMEKRAAKWKLDTLQLQLNPHFIFNALGSVQSYILRQNHIAAEKYLVKFSNLIRTVLDSSRKSTITLEKELKLLQDYIDMEQMRFPEHFDVQWEIQEIDPETEIPSMMLQPFIENAIEWGIIPNERKGNLWIRMIKEEKYIQVEIEDDGVGRRRAEASKVKFGKKGTGNAMNILKERELLMEKLEGVMMKYEIIDKANDEGTIVKVTLPIMS
ncbi:MAG: histidine kinase [Bacteroidia bacterium]